MSYKEKFPKVDWTKQEMTEHIKNPDCYINMFASWEVLKTEVDEFRAIYTLRNPENTAEKICMFVDSHVMFIYGSYGSLSFDRMTWVGSPKNLAYQDMGYQMSKLSSEDYIGLRVFNDDKCRENLIQWFSQHIFDYYRYNNDEIKKIVDVLIDKGFDLYSYGVEEDVEMLLENCVHGSDEIAEEAIFFVNALNNMDDAEMWITFWQNSYETVMDFADNNTYMDIRDFGLAVHGRFYVNMLAMFILNEKLNGNM